MSTKILNLFVNRLGHLVRLGLRVVVVVISSLFSIIFEDKTIILVVLAPEKFHQLIFCIVLSIHFLVPRAQLLGALLVFRTGGLVALFCSIASLSLILLTFDLLLSCFGISFWLLAQAVLVKYFDRTLWFVGLLLVCICLLLEFLLPEIIIR